MKKAIMFPVLCLCIAMLSACCKADPPIEATEQAISGEIYDTGEFRVLVPAHWRVFPIEDPFAPERTVKTDCLFLRKGGSSDWKVFEKPYIRIDYYGPDREPEEQEADPEIWRNLQDIAPMELGGILWNGYTADNYHGKACVGRFALLWAQKERFRVLVCLESGGERVCVEDPDLQAILASIAPS